MHARAQQGKLPQTSPSIIRPETDQHLATAAKTKSPGAQFSHSFAGVPVFSPTLARAISSGHAGGVTEVVRPSPKKGSCGCHGTCGKCSTVNTDGRRSSEFTTQSGGPAAAPAAGGGGAATAAPARRAELLTGPRYTPNGTIAPATASGVTSFGPWTMSAQFKNDHARGIFAGCGEVHQDIKWNAAAAASFRALVGRDVPHAGFPAGHPPNVWIEDRDDTNTNRYGRRSGPFSHPVPLANEYTNATGAQDMLHGATFHGRDNPSGPAAATGQWKFMLLAFDMCNQGVQVGSADFIEINW